MSDSCVLLSTFKQLLDAGLLPDDSLTQGLTQGLTQNLLTGSGDLSGLRALMQTVTGAAPSSLPPPAPADPTIHAQLRRRLPRRLPRREVASPVVPADPASPALPEEPAPAMYSPRARPLLFHATEGKLVDGKLRIYHERLAAAMTGGAPPAVDEVVHRLKQTLRSHGPCSAILTAAEHVAPCMLRDVKYFVNEARRQRIVEFTLDGETGAAGPGGVVTAVKLFVSDVAATE